MNSTKASQYSKHGKDYKAQRRYSHIEELVNNLPYTAMTLLGAAVFIVSLKSSPLGWIGATLYLLYGIAGAFWIIIFLCPYCRYCNTRSCPCGYGSIAGKLREKKPDDCFNEKFKKHIPVIVPLWFIPILVAVPFVIRTFTWLLLLLLIVFAIDAFVVLPLVSTKHGCKNCPQRDSCPWMSRKSKPTAHWQDR
jgi:hypothetical protein